MSIIMKGLTVILVVVGVLTGTSKSQATVSPPGLNWDDCGETRGCYRDPPGCSPSDCDIIVSWEDGEDMVNFELQMNLEGTSVEGQAHWIALGVSDTRIMGETSVIACMNPSGDQFTRAEASFNGPEISPRVLNDDTLGIVNGSFVGITSDAVSSCKFSRFKALPPGTPEEEFVYDISSPNEYYLLLGYGAINDDNTKAMHAVNPTVTLSKINFESTENEAGVFIEPLVKAHATLMFAAWALFSGIGIMNARYFKKAWPSIEIGGLKLWFVIHRVCMTLVMVLTLISFIIIFVHVNGFSQLGAASPSVVQSHPILGIIVLTCVLANPTMAMFRPTADAPKRPIFNWAHRIVGEGGRIVAVFNLMTGLNLPASNAIVEDWMFWAMIAAICVHIIIEAVLMAKKFLKDKKVQATYSMEMIAKGTDEKPEIEEQSYTLETVLLIVYAAFVTSLTLAILITIAIK